MCEIFLQEPMIAAVYQCACLNRLKSWWLEVHELCMQMRQAHRRVGNRGSRSLFRLRYHAWMPSSASARCFFCMRHLTTDGHMKRVDKSS